MGEVVEFEPPAGDAETHMPHRQLRRGAALLDALIVIIGIGLLAFVATVLILGLALGGAFLSLGPNAAYLGPQPDLPGIVAFASLPKETRLAYAATFLLDMAPALFVLLNLHALLRLYAMGRLLGSKNGRHLARMAMGLGAYALAPLVGHQLLALAGHGVDMAWFHASEVHALILAAVLILLAKAMDTGFEAEQDRGGFV